MTINIQQIKDRLEIRLMELQERINGLNEAYPIPAGPIEAGKEPQDFEEAAVDLLDKEQKQSLLVNEQTLLTQVQGALSRIEEGTYGRCIVCGQLIPEKRLEALPWASRCIKDEEQRERGI